ncbi:MAG TPA: BatA domain-containing protein [Terriglobia bacterium]|nr:BatA domain-containing protein [Terriglobia bacterium]
MIFTSPLGLLALLAMPAIVAIHLFRRRFPPREVAGLFLWQVVRQTPEGGGKITRLPITASLILECVAALALALIVAGARLQPAGASEHLVVLLDDSASMAATNALGESPRDRAVRRVLGEIERLGSGGRITLVQSGQRPSVLLGPAALAVEAAPVLEKWKPQAPHHSPSLGLRLARELAGRTGRLMVLSDAPPDPAVEGQVEGAVWVSLGEPLANVGITAAQRTVSAIALALGNFSDVTTRRRLRVVASEREVMAKEIELPPGPSSLNLPLPMGLPSLRVILSDDALLRDNEAILVEPRPQIVAVENRLGEGRGRQALDKAIGSLAGVIQAKPGHLVFEPASELDEPPSPGAWRVGFGRASAKLIAAGEPKDFVGPFVTEKRHSLLQGVTLAGVVWTGASPLAADKVHPLVSAGDRPLIAMPALPGAPSEAAILFNLDLDRTNLIRAPDWPILISNLVEMRRQNLPGPDRWNYRAGEWVRVRLGRDPTGPLHFRCSGVERDLPPGRLLEFIAPSPGGLLQVMEGNDVLFELGVNFLDEEEADLRDRAAGEIGKFNPQSGRLRTENGPASDPLFWALVAIGGAAIVANWCLLAPRRSNA